MMAAPSLALLRIMAKDKRQWSLARLQEESDLPEPELVQVLQWLRKQKLIRRIKGLYGLTPTGAVLAAEPAPAPKVIKSDLRSLVWRALRMSQKASVTELLELIGKPATKGTRHSVHAYLTKLCDTGIIGISRFQGARGERLYQVLRDIGPAAPATDRATGHLIDPNSGSVLEVRDAAAA